MAVFLNDVTERYAANDANRLLANASVALAGSLDVLETADAVVRAAIPTLGDWAVLDLLDEDGTLRRIAGAHVDAAKDALVREIVKKWRPDPAAPFGAMRVVSTGEAQFAPDLTPAREYLTRFPGRLEEYDAVGFHSYVCVPLRARGRTIGALAFVSGTRRHDESELPVARELAARAALALDNARLHEAANIARAAAEADAARVRELHALTAALAGAVTVDDVAAVALERARLAFGANGGLFNLVSDDGAEIVHLRSVGFDGATLLPWHRYPMSAGTPGTDAIRRDAPVYIESLAECEARYPVVAREVAHHGYRAFAVFPMRVGGRVFGLYAFHFHDARTFAPLEREQMIAFAGQCALALARARLFDAERQQRETAEALSARLGDVLETMTDALFEYDHDWKLVHANAAAREWMRASGGELGALIGRSLWELYPHLRGTRFAERLQHAMDTRESVAFRALSVERARWVETRAYPTRRGLAAYVRDVDAEVRAEQRLELLADTGRALASAFDARATLDAIARLVVPRVADGCTIDLIDTDGTMERVALYHTDASKRELLAESARRNPHAARRMESSMAARLLGGESVLLPDVASLDALVPDAHHREAIARVGIRSYMMVPLLDGATVLGAISFMMTESPHRYDADDLALAEELARRSAAAVVSARLYERERAARADAEAANQAKMDFLATMSHELRTPLNAIGGHAQLLELGIHGPVTDAQREALARIQGSQGHLLGLINDVLNFAKLDAGRVEYRLATVRLGDVVRDVSALVAPQFVAKEIHYVSSACDARVVVRADADKVRQILLNLLSNAVKFTPRGGAVTVSCGRGAESANGVTGTLRVADTGLGIPPEKHAHVFEPFVQLGRSLSTGHEGTGLGLAISRDLARGMGGDLTVISDVGAGAEFVLSLPLAE